MEQSNINTNCRTCIAPNLCQIICRSGGFKCPSHCTFCIFHSYFCRLLTFLCNFLSRHPWSETPSISDRSGDLLRTAFEVCFVLPASYQSENRITDTRRNLRYCSKPHLYNPIHRMHVKRCLPLPLKSCKEGSCNIGISALAVIDVSDGNETK